MKISISIEPFLANDMDLLPAYLDEIVKLHQSNPDLSLHFDYFQPNPKVLALIESNYAAQIDTYAHIMGMTVQLPLYQTVAIDVHDYQPAIANSIVFDLGDQIDGYESLIKAMDYVTVMSVKCGKSGQSFNAAALDLIPKIRAINPSVTIILDGGINENNLEMVKKAGVDIAVIGSYAKKCFQNGNFHENLNRLLRV